METDIGSFLINEYRFIGIAIFIMAGVIAYLFIDGKRERLKTEERHRQERLQMQKEHKEERAEWRGENKKLFDASNETSKEMISVVRSIETLIKSQTK